MAVPFPFDKQEDLISAVERRPALYNRADENYTNRGVIQSLWNEISDELECEASLCKARWQGLRDYLLKKKRENEKCKRKGLPLRRPWFLYKRLAFVLPFSSTRKNKERPDTPPTPPSPRKTEMEDSEEEEMSELSQSRPIKSSPESVYSASVEPQDNDPTQSCSAEVAEGSGYKKRKGNSESDGVVDSNFPSLRREPEDDHELFFRSLLPTVSQFDEINTMCFRAEVQQLAAKYMRQQRGIISNECSSCNCNKLNTMPTLN